MRGAKKHHLKNFTKIAPEDKNPLGFYIPTVFQNFHREQYNLLSLVMIVILFGLLRIRPPFSLGQSDGFMNSLDSCVHQVDNIFSRLSSSTA